MEAQSQSTPSEDTLQRLSGTPTQRDSSQPSPLVHTPSDSTGSAVDPSKASPSGAVALSRSGTLSWQQRRPNSTLGRRPLSMVAADRSASRSPQPQAESGASEDMPVTKDHIAKTLGAKDPPWFKQTADRGIGNAAYRRSQEDTESETGSISGRRQLPGMSQEQANEMEGASSPPPDSVRSSSPSRASSVRGSTVWSQRFSNSTSLSGFSSPLPTLDSQKFAPPSDQASSIDPGDVSGSARTLAMSPSQGRISPERMERPASPTKGMGGFVQSAMLKRSDSVNKRWSAQPSTGISRQNSTASTRSGFGSLKDSGTSSAPKPEPKPEPKPSNLSRGNSVEPSSRPSSSHSNSTITQNSEPKTDKDVFVKPALPYHSRGKSVSAITSAASPEEDKAAENSPPPSPSKRWSPTKSSWLESALSKPDSPKPKMPPPQQPSWMAEISKARQQRASVDLGKKDSSNGASPIVSLRSTKSTNFPKSPESSTPTPKEKTLEKMKSTSSFTPTSTPQVKSKPPVLSPKPSTKEPSVAAPKKADDEPAEAPQDASTPAPLNFKPVKATPSTTASVKPKPDTLPKKDFRSTLKSRQGPAETPRHEEPEFKNVFGKLRRIQTEKYVAPDELKSNILRGKAGLHNSVGPIKTERRDELKESLLQQKEAMKAKAAEIGDTPKKAAPVPPAQKTPEALVKRKHLGRAESITHAAAPKERDPPTPEAISRQKSLREKQSADAIKPLARAPTRGSSPDDDNVIKPIDGLKGKLAGRFNPALASMIARGPSPIKGSSSAATSTITSTFNATNEGSKDLTHMTKGRARGPKRRAPAKKDGPAQEESSSGKVDSRPAARALPRNIASSPAAETTTTTPETPGKRMSKPKPETPAKSPQLAEKLQEPTRSISSPTPRSPPLAERFTAKSATPSVSPISRSLPQGEDAPKPLRIEKKMSPTVAQEDVTKTSEAPSVKNAATLWGRQSTTPSPTMTRSRSPIKLPTHANERKAMEDAGLSRPLPKPNMGLGIGGLRSIPDTSVTKPNQEMPTRAKSPLSPPLSAIITPNTPPKPGKKPESIRSPILSMQATQAPQSDASRLLNEFFDEQPVTSGELQSDINIEALLSSNPNDSAKIRTLRKHIQEITGDGKLHAVPSDYVLYDSAMYICTHVFGDAKGARNTEVYHWVGSTVPESTVEDAQLFAKRIAKENNGRLIILRQGKESPNFFEALGGIVIIRRGNPQDSKSSFLLGCRRHMGHVAFDEVAFSLNNFCSGFPFIVSSDTGKLFLWKGIGCGAEELGSARLIGMDLGPSGDIEEVDEGHEPRTLLDLFPALEDGSKKIPASAGHWRLKASYEQYNARLFRVDQQQPQLGFQTPKTPTTPTLPKLIAKVTEIAPFCQTDLEAEHVYVLDAFFEIYIIVGALARSQSHAFSTALLFAQEYGILAASMQDRPLIPVTTVVLEGVPKDMKAVFRRWEEHLMPTSALMAGKPRRGKSLRIIGLADAIAATKA